MDLPSRSLNRSSSLHGPGRLRGAAQTVFLMSGRPECSASANQRSVLLSHPPQSHPIVLNPAGACRNHNGYQFRPLLSTCESGSEPLPQINQLVLLLASLLAIPLACQCCFHATLFARFQIVGMTLYFLDDVFLLNLPLEAAQSIFERLAFLYTNFRQNFPPPNLPKGQCL